MTDNWRIAQILHEAPDAFDALIEDNEKLQKQIDLKDSEIEDLNRTIKEQSTKIEDLEYELSHLPDSSTGME